MSQIPRILPLVGIAVGGVLALNAMSGAEGLPDLVSGAKAFAEETAQTAKDAGKGAASAKPAKPGEGAPAADQAATDAAAKTTAAPGAKPSAAVCAPTAAELAKEAGLSPAELQVLQSLSARRGQLDKREQDMDVQLALLAAAEAKLDAKMKALTGLKGDIQGLLNQAKAGEDAEVLRMVKVYEGMKPKDAAARMTVLDDSVRLPIAAKMKERALSAMLAAMAPADAKKLTESLAKRFSDAKGLAAEAQKVADGAAPAASAGKAPGKAAAAAPAPAAPNAGPKKAG